MFLNGEKSAMKISFDSKAFERDLRESIAACNEFMAKNYGNDPFYGFRNGDRPGLWRVLLRHREIVSRLPFSNT